MTFPAFWQYVPPFYVSFLHFPMFLLSLPLPTMAFPTCSKYFPPLYAVFLHFPMFLLSFPLLTITFPTFSRFTFLFTSSGLPYFPAFSHVFALISSPYHHISCMFTLFYTISFASLFSSFPPFYNIFLHFLMLLLSHLFCLPSHFMHFHSIFYDFYYIILRYSATKIADLGGIDTHRQTIV